MRNLQCDDGNQFDDTVSEENSYNCMRRGDGCFVSDVLWRITLHEWSYYRYWGLQTYKLSPVEQIIPVTGMYRYFCLDNIVTYVTFCRPTPLLNNEGGYRPTAGMCSMNFVLCTAAVRLAVMKHLNRTLEVHIF